MASGSGWLTARLAAVVLVVGAAGAALLALRGCNDSASGDVAVIRIAGHTFHPELALDMETRFRGLSGRTFVEPDGGLLFVFPRADEMHFVMRDCPIPIDILFLDPAGRVVAAHEMLPEPPRTEEEKALSASYQDAPQWAWTNTAYEERLKKYPSRYSAQFAVELAGGTIKRIGVKEGDRVTLDADALKRRAK